MTIPTTERRELQSLVQTMGQPDGLPIKDCVASLQSLRERTPKRCAELDRLLITAQRAQRQAIGELQKIHEQLGNTITQLKAAPLHPGVVLRVFPDAEHPKVEVALGGRTRHIVTLLPGLDPTTIAPGDEVHLTRDRNAIVARSPYGMPPWGQMALFERYVGDGRAIIQHRDETFMVPLAVGLGEADLHHGDTVRWDPEVGIVYEKVERATGEHLFLEQSPTESFDRVGGLDGIIARLKDQFTISLRHAGVAASYKVQRVGGVLLKGPAGVGKTMVTRALANWLGDLFSAGRSMFMNIKPASQHSVWFSQSEANYRELFRAAKAATARSPGVPVVMFFDEIDAIGNTRGGLGSHIDDRVMTAFMAELDGLEDRGDIVVIGATNRPDAIDPALLRPGRLGDLVLEIPRPNQEAARQIFARYLDADMPYAPNGHGADMAATRHALIDAATAHVYCRNGDGALATIGFRDGKQHVVDGADLINGAIIANSVRSAAHGACRRQVATGEPGIRLSDVIEAVDEQLATTAATLTPANARHHVSGLPQDVDIVRVDPPAGSRVKRPYRFLEVT